MLTMLHDKFVIYIYLTYADIYVYARKKESIEKF